MKRVIGRCPGFVLLAAVLVAAWSGCQRSPIENSEDEQEGAPRVEAGELVVSTASQEAIGLATATIGCQEVRAALSTAGWLQAAPAREVVVKAPLTGFFVPDSRGGLRLGQMVSKDQRLAQLHAFLSPQEQAQLVAAKEEADILIEQSRASLQLAEGQLKRLQAEGPKVVAGTRLLELKETIARSRAAEQQALEQLPFLPAEPYADELQLKAVSLTAPFEGRLARVHVAPRQLVIQGDALCTIADWSRLWVRVPVFAADLPRILTDQPVQVQLPGRPIQLAASAVEFTQPTNPGKQTTELYFEVSNDGTLRPGQSVRVSLPLEGGTSKLVVPPAAVLWDGMGNSWVYQAVTATKFRRRKVELGQTVGDAVPVLRGLNAGDTIVTAGVEALYGEEFKWQIPGEDDD